jgi:O-acetyl-ADP-ribose deacetylase
VARADPWSGQERIKLSEGATRLAPHRIMGVADAWTMSTDTGDAMATPAFDLDPPVRHIIHTVGPVWEGGSYGEEDTLASCYRRQPRGG